MHSDPRAEVLTLCHQFSLTTEPQGGRITIANRSQSFRQSFANWWAAQRYLTRSLREWDGGGACPAFFLP